MRQNMNLHPYHVYEHRIDKCRTESSRVNSCQVSMPNNEERSANRNRKKRFSISQNDVFSVHFFFSISSKFIRKKSWASRERKLKLFQLKLINSLILLFFVLDFHLINDENAWPSFFFLFCIVNEFSFLVVIVFGFFSSSLFWFRFRRYKPDCGQD